MRLDISFRAGIVGFNERGFILDGTGALNPFKTVAVRDSSGAGGLSLEGFSDVSGVGGHSMLDNGLGLINFFKQY